ncbi:MAG TPA: hypothetical protein VLL75_04005, partial [Vicinamibacteria bacterium]|nr:hypothetical protein [Vicinamibacteria bacterium]
MTAGLFDRLLTAGAAVCLCALPAVPAAAGDDVKPGDRAAKPPSKYISPEDGWLDLSAWLDEPWGFVPIVWPPSAA